MAAFELIPVSGFANGAFAPVADVFARAVAEQGVGGAGLTVIHDGELVADLQGGDFANLAQPALVPVYSVSKAATAIAMAMLQEAGEVDLDEPLGEVWPELAKRSTAAITPRLVLSHRSGLASLDRALTLDELLAFEDETAIGTQEPYWEPGTAHGYHASTYGTLANGYLRRKIGRIVGEVVAQRIAGPQELELWIGAPAELEPRIQRMQYLPPAITPTRQAHVKGSPIPPGSTGRIAATMDLFNDPRMHGASFPASSGVASAPALARLMAGTLDGSLLSAAARDGMIATQARGIDRVLGTAMHYGSGMQLPWPQLLYVGPRSYGHEAAGGSVAFADAEYGIAVGFTTNAYPRMMGAAPGFLTILGALQYCLTADQSTVS